MSEISVIVFDLGNVLIKFDYNIVRKKLNSVENNLGDRLRQYYYSNYFLHRNFERGEITEDDFVNTMLKVLDNKIDREFFCEAYSNIFTVNQKVVDLLPLLKKNYQLILLSNTDPLHRKYGWQKYDFLKYFDKIILSYEVGAVKPEDKIYKEVESFTKKQPGEHFFTDDIPEYVDAAKKRGWEAVQFNGYEALKERLIKLGIIQNKTGL